MSSRTGTKTVAYKWPASPVNWRAAIAGSACAYTEEYPVYTDAWVTGQIDAGFGPYEFINALGLKEAHEAHLYPSVVVRIDWHLPPGALNQSLGAKNADSYHGGNVEDELAALLGLCLGIRARAGGASRYFGPDVGPRGRLQPGTHKPVYQIPLPRMQGRVLPWATGTHNLDDARILPFERLYSLDEGDASALVKAARLHQEALWIAEGSPEVAWILLVTAVEACAKQWGAAMHPTWRATKRFTEFLLAFLPNPPATRPHFCYRHGWDSASMRASIAKVYAWRSAFMHEGVQFPKPMCLPPHQEDKRYSEIPIGLAMAVPGGTWPISETPLLLHLFEYIVREAILKWWKWCLPSVPYLNSAGEKRLQKIPGIGSLLAGRIVRERHRRGSFKSFDELARVKGVGTKVIAAIAEHTTLIEK